MLFRSSPSLIRPILAAAIVCFAIGSTLPDVAQAADAEEAAAKPAKSEPAQKSGKAQADQKPGKRSKPEAKAGQADRSKGPATGPLANPELANETAPAVFRVAFETTKGPIIVEVQRAWAPNGADRFYNLVKIGFYDDIAFFRVIDGFMAQFGIHGTPAINRAWQRAVIKDDPVVESNLRGTLTFAKTNRPHSRTSQVFINFSDNVNLDRMGFAPFARVVEGMDVVDQIYKVGEGKPRGKGPSQRRIQVGGNEFLKRTYPDLDYIRGARVLD